MATGSLLLCVGAGWCVGVWDPQLDRHYAAGVLRCYGGRLRRCRLGGGEERGV